MTTVANTVITLFNCILLIQTVPWKSHAALLTDTRTEVI